VKQKPIEEIEKELGSLLERYMGPVEQVAKNEMQDVIDIEETPKANIIPDDDELDAAFDAVFDAALQNQLSPLPSSPCLFEATQDPPSPPMLPGTSE